MLIEAFKQIINIQGIDLTYYKMEDGSEYSVKCAPSNYYRYMSGIAEDMSYNRQEFVIAKESLDFRPKRGDRLYNDDFGNLTILDVREMIIFGQLAGYRLRVE